MATGQAIVEVQRGPGLLTPMTNLAGFQQQLKEFQSFVDGYLVESKEGTTDGDYGTIPGTKKPTLFKSGAEKLCEVYGMAPDAVILKEIEDYERGLFDYTIKVNLTSRRDGSFVGSGVGSCSSYESKYRYRIEGRRCPNCDKDTIRKGATQYGGGWYCNAKAGGCGAKFLDADQKIVNQQTGRITNPDMADVKNTVLKMAKKRALIDAVLSVTRSSAIFAQDLDDIEPGAAQPEGARHVAPQPTSQPEKAATSTTPAETKEAPAGRQKAPSTKGKAVTPAAAAKEASAPAPSNEGTKQAESTLPKAQIPPAPPVNGKPKNLKEWAREIAAKVQSSPDRLVGFLKRVLRAEDLKAVPEPQKIVALNALERVAGMTWPTGMSAVTAFVHNEGLTPDFKAVEAAYADLLISVSDEPPKA
jgi:hypothetical protein